MKKIVLVLLTAGMAFALPLAFAEDYEWTNKLGKTIKAEFVSATNDTVTISMKGRPFVLQLADLSPQSQALARKLGAPTPDPFAPAIAAPRAHEWTNKLGKTIKAEFVSATNDTVTISMKGRPFVLQLADLSPQSQALAKKLSEPAPNLNAKNSILEKVQRISIPGVNFFDTPLPEALQTLMNLSRQNDFAEPDPAAKGVNIIPMIQGQAPPRLTIQLNKMSLERMLDFITEMVDWSYEVREDAIVVSKGGGGRVGRGLEIEFYELTQALIRRMTGAGGPAGAGGPRDPFAPPGPGQGPDGKAEKIKNFLMAAGIEFDDDKGHRFVFDGFQMIVTNSKANQQLLKRLLQQLDPIGIANQQVLVGDPNLPNRDPNEVVKFRDRSLEAAMKEQLQKKQGKLIVKDFQFPQEIGLFSFENLGISTLSGIEIFANTPMVGFDFSSNRITDLKPLAVLVNVRALSLNENSVRDIDPLATMVSLQELALAKNRISDVSPLVGLKRLASVDLSGNPIRDLTPLAKMPQLRSLGLEGIRLSQKQKESLQKALPNCRIFF